MNLSYYAPPSALLWAEDLYAYIQAYKAGTFPNVDAVYEQFGSLIIPEITAHGAGGPFDAYFAIKFGNDGSAIELSKPITAIYIWSVVNHAPASLMLQANPTNLFAAQVVAAPSATALQKLLFHGDDGIGLSTTLHDSSNDVLRGWAGNDSLYGAGSGGTDRFYGGAGNDRITIYDGEADTTHGVRQRFFGYGDAGDDILQGDDWGDRLFGGIGQDSLLGFEGADRLSGGAGLDTLGGGTGNDVLDGGDDNDLMYGSVGVDVLTGGNGADLFVFTWGGPVPHLDSGKALARRDSITDFTPGEDKLKLLESGLAHVTLIGSDAFSGVNQVRWVSTATDTTVFINATGTLAADMAITLLGVTALQNTDFEVL